MPELVFEADAELLYRTSYKSREGPNVRWAVNVRIPAGTYSSPVTANLPQHDTAFS